MLDCPEAVAFHLDRVAVWTSVGRRQYLLHQGDYHQQCHVVVSGSADIRVLGREGQYIQIATLEPGEIFGAYPTPGVVRADIQAHHAMELVSLDTARLARLALDYAPVGAGLARIFAGQLSSILDRFAARVSLTAAGRVYFHLLGLMDPTGVIGTIPAVAALAVKAQTTRETASRAVSVIERRGIMRRESGRWVITSPRLLEELVI